MRNHRLATEADLPAIKTLMDRSISLLQSAFLSPEAVAASRLVMGLDTRLVADRTYLLIEEDGVLAGCGGWSRRATLYGGDHTAGTRDDALLDPALDAARIRAMYTDPAYARRGVGRCILRLCEEAAAAAGFGRVELMATAAGMPLYLASGYTAIAGGLQPAPQGIVPLIHMGKPITPGTMTTV